VLSPSAVAEPVRSRAPSLSRQAGTTSARFAMKSFFRSLLRVLGAFNA
jgi:hypothetical protein